ncbi:TniQ family protein [Lichenibacterium dinghuense]|uniref:TniQ family protein n=1 Tax=Lichenibacterium dinghuense TaxID=2895977 RepID=UPI001F3B9D6C|nr:TniQ family protein [Lichenibacterium sp. 6Y81]
MALPFEFPAFPADETLQGFVSRVARHYETDLANFCDVAGISVTGLTTGADRAIARVADITGIPAATLRPRAFVRLDPDRVAYRGQTFQRRDLRRVELHGCPACLRADLAGSSLEPDVATYVRGSWFVRGIRTCPVHDVGFVRLAGEGRNPVRSGGPYVSVERLTTALEDLDALERAAPRRRPSAFETYLGHRLRGRDPRRPSPLLDDMPLHAATRTCEMVGAVALFGPKVAVGVLDEEDWRAASAAGFDLVSGGAGQVRSLLDHLQDTHEPGRSRNGKSRDVFGKLYAWARAGAGDPDYAPVRDLLREHILDTMPVDVGDDVLGVVVERRRVHSVATACHDGRQTSRRLRRELVAAGVLSDVPDDDRHRAVAAPVERVDALVGRLAAALSKAQAAAHLGLSILQFQRLVDDGLIHPVVPKVRTERTWSRFCAEELEAFLARLAKGARPCEAPPPGAVGIAEAARLTNVGSAAIIRLLMARKLPGARRRPTIPGVPSFLVDVAEIERVHKAQVVPHLRFSAVAGRLQVNLCTPAALAARGHLRTTTVVGARTHRTSRFVTLASVEAFTARMASLVELSRTYGLHNCKMKRLLDEKGVDPAIPNGQVLANFYDRARVEAVLPIENVRGPVRSD